MKTRIISAICMLPLLILLYLGGYFLAALCIAIGFIGMREFFNGFRHMGINPSDRVGYVMLFILYFINGLWPTHHGLILAWIVAVIMVCSLLMFDSKKHTPMDAMATMVGLIYIVFFSFHVVLIDETGGYSDMKWLVIIAAFGSDIFAYFTGKLLGKHKLCPNLSPHKTIEGLIGGLLGGGICSLLFGFLICPAYIGSCAVIGFFGAGISVLGDLTASAYKRKMGIKDYGNLIPGHGGIMDRFDSVLFTAPFVYYYTAIVMEHFQIIF